VVPPDVEHNGHLYYLLLRTPGARDRFIAAMRARGITTPFHYVPLDTSPAGKRFARAQGTLPCTHDAADRLVRLPLWFEMAAEQDEVIAATLAELRRA
jgi:dTDP-4-amino-4,6-dideoxygalactose transaminase